MIDSLDIHMRKIIWLSNLIYLDSPDISDKTDENKIQWNLSFKTTLWPTNMWS